eukprot:756092-Hanusia_phi.AAC.1
MGEGGVLKGKTRGHGVWSFLCSVSYTGTTPIPWRGTKIGTNGGYLREVWVARRGWGSMGSKHRVLATCRSAQILLKLQTIHDLGRGTSVGVGGVGTDPPESHRCKWRVLCLVGHRGGGVE